MGADLFIYLGMRNRCGVTPYLDTRNVLGGKTTLVGREVVGVARPVGSYGVFGQRQVRRRDRAVRAARNCGGVLGASWRL